MSNAKLERYKALTRNVYEKHSHLFEHWYKTHFRKRVKRQADTFIKRLQGNTVVDLGSGPGTHAGYFHHKGLDVICVDYSQAMLKMCSRHGVKALLVDIEDFWMPDATVDGIWMYSSLTHIRDEEIPKILKNLARILKPRGLLGVAVREGNDAGYEAFDKGSKEKRYFNYFTDDEMRHHFTPHFDILEFSRTKYDKKKVYLNYLLRKKAES